MASADLLLHPVRLRIVKAFLGDRALTTSQLAAELSDVPAGSIYRHVARLTRAGVLQVVAERRVRGAVERTYTLRLPAAQIQPGEVAQMTLDQHGHAFLAYVAGLLGDFDRYAAGAPDPRCDGVGYRVAGMWLTDAELADLLRDLAAVVQPRLANAPARDRRRRLLYGVFLPGPEAASDVERRTSGSSAQPPEPASPASERPARQRARRDSNPQPSDP
ncbi:MAG: helix-turn-helix domain-containing protein [Acidimicrobiales bacterium]